MKELIIQALNEAKVQIIQNIDKEGIKASGRTQKGFIVEDRGNSIVLASNGYGIMGAPFSTLQYGREGGKVPYNFTAILVQWMKDKGITPDPIPYKTDRPHKYSPVERGFLQRAYFISKKIQERGTDRHTTPNERVYSEVIKDTVDNLRSKLIFQIKSEFYGR